MNKRKSLKELNLLDKFLFDEAMDDPENVKTMLDIIRRVVSQELIELLKYMEHSTDEVSEQCKSERIQKMHRRVCRIKASEKTEVKYMQAWEEKLLERQKEKRELLRKMNHKMSIEKIADVLDMDVSEVKHIIEEQYDTED